MICEIFNSKYTSRLMKYSECVVLKAIKAIISGKNYFKMYSI